MVIFFDPRGVRVGFMAKKVALIHGFLSVLFFCPVGVIPPLLYNHISFIHPQPNIGLILAFDMVFKENSLHTYVYFSLYIYIFLLVYNNTFHYNFVRSVIAVKQ